MRLKRLRKGTRVLNKLNGKMYCCIDKQNDEATLISVSEEDAESSDLQDMITVTEKNDICFRIIEEPIPSEVFDISQYTVEDGVLYKNEQAVTDQGEIRILNIIGGVRGGMLLTVIPKVRQLYDKGYVDLFFYDPETDYFKKVYRNLVPCFNILFNDEDFTVMAYSRCEIHESQDERGNTITEKLFSSAGVLVYTDGNIYSTSFTVPIDIEHSLVVRENDSLYFAVNVKECCDEENAYKAVKTCEPYVRPMVYHNGSYVLFKGYPMNDQAKSVTVSYLAEEPSVLIKSKDCLVYTGTDTAIRSSKVLDEVEGYDHIADITFTSNCGYEMTLANGHYETKTIVCRTTKDRGLVYQVK